MREPDVFERMAEVGMTRRNVLMAVWVLADDHVRLPIGKMLVRERWAMLLNNLADNGMVSGVAFMIEAAVSWDRFGCGVRRHRYHLGPSGS